MESRLPDLPLSELSIIRTENYSYWTLYYPNYSPKFLYKVANHIQGETRSSFYRRLSRHELACTPSSRSFCQRVKILFFEFNFKKYMYYVLYVHYIFPHIHYIKSLNTCSNIVWVIGQRDRLEGIEGRERKQLMREGTEIWKKDGMINWKLRLMDYLLPLNSNKITKRIPTKLGKVLNSNCKDRLEYPSEHGFDNWEPEFCLFCPRKRAHNEICQPTSSPNNSPSLANRL